jgi:hypothetical protein
MIQAEAVKEMIGPASVECTLSDDKRDGIVAHQSQKHAGFVQPRENIDALKKCSSSRRLGSFGQCCLREDSLDASPERVPQSR